MMDFTWGDIRSIDKDIINYESCSHHALFKILVLIIVHYDTRTDGSG